MNWITYSCWNSSSSHPSTSAHRDQKRIWWNRFYHKRMRTQYFIMWVFVRARDFYINFFFFLIIPYAFVLFLDFIYFYANVVSVTTLFCTFIEGDKTMCGKMKNLNVHSTSFCFSSVLIFEWNQREIYHKQRFRFW